MPTVLCEHLSVPTFQLQLKYIIICIIYSRFVCCGGGAEVVDSVIFINCIKELTHTKVA